MTRLLLTYVLFATCCLFAGCNDLPWQRGEVEGYVPVYSTEPMLKQISFGPPRKTVNGGKLFTAGTNVLQEELDSGLHIISYQDPANPVKTGFLRIPGFQVATIEGNYLYANNYNDLIAVPLNALSANMTIGRVAGVWQQLDYPTGPQVYYFECVDTSKGVVIGWRKAKIHDPQCRRNVLSNDGPGENIRNNAGLVTLHNKLYLVNPEFIAVYSLSSPGLPVITQKEAVLGSQVDSIFPVNDMLGVMNRGFMDLYDTARLADAGYYNNVSPCMKLTTVGHIGYSITGNKYGCNTSYPYLVKYDLKKDTNAVVESGSLDVGKSNAFAISGNYIYIAGETGLVIVNTAGPSLEKAGTVNDDTYSDIVVNGNLLFLTGKQHVVAYSIAASPVSPRLVSKLAY